MCIHGKFKDDALQGYHIIFAPANHTNGFMVTSFGNAIIYKAEDTAEPLPYIDILYSPPPALPPRAPLGPREGRVALKIVYNNIPYICLHLDDRATYGSQIGMLENFMKCGLFDGHCIVCGDMNVLDISINPIKSIEEKPTTIAGPLRIEESLEKDGLTPEDLERGKGAPGLDDKVIQQGDFTHTDRSLKLWGMFKKAGLKSIYETAEEVNKHIMTSYNSGGIDYIGYDRDKYTVLQTGVIYPVLYVDSKLEGGDEISDHLLPFLVFNKVNTD